MSSSPGKFPIEGGCYCGKIRYRISAEPIDSAICHCETCRRVAGAESVAWAVCAENSFEVGQGQPSTLLSSEGVERYFCDACGTSLTYKVSPGFIDVTLGSLDNPELIRPRKEVWIGERVSWNPLDESLEHFSHEGSQAQ